MKLWKQDRFLLKKVQGSAEEGLRLADVNPLSFVSLNDKFWFLKLDRNKNKQEFVAHGNTLQAAHVFSFACPSRDSRETGQEIDRGGDTQENMVLLTEFIMYFGQLIEILQLALRAFALC